MPLGNWKTKRAGMECILLLVVISTVECTVTSGNKVYRCSKCTCTKAGDSIIVDCESRKLTEIPDLCEENVTEFILSGNSFSQVRSKTFVKCARLVNLHLERSGIEIVDEGSFDGLSSLRFLNLSCNFIRLYSQSLNTSYFFKPLSNLEVLDLSSNVHLGRYKYKYLLNGLRSLPKINLKTLILAKITSSHIYSDNDITSTFLETIKTSSLTKLDLSFNKIGRINGLIAAYAPSLEELHLRENRLHLIGFLLGLKHLKYLDFSYQTKESSRQSLRTFDLPLVPFKRNITKFRSPLQKFFVGCRNGAITNNTIFRNYIDKTTKHNDSNVLIWPRNLTRFNARQIVDGGIIPESFIFFVYSSQNISGVHFDFSYNKVTEILGTVEASHPLSNIHIDFSDNNCQNISKHAFGKNLASAVTSLNLKNNKLGQMLSQNGGVLSYMNNLKHLDLTYNDIFNLSPKVFTGMNSKSLEKIILKDNNLLDIPHGITSLVNLKYLDISRNRISYLSPDTISHFSDFIKSFKRRGKTIRIDLSGNRVECSCTSLHFLKWMHTFRSSFYNINATFCNLKGRRVSLSRLRAEILPQLEKGCFSLRWLYAIAGVLAIVLLCVTLSVIAYRHRWDVRYICLRVKIRRELYAELYEERGAFEYDAFVAYSERDFIWVESHLIPKLEEGENPFRLCVHHRDFEIGWPIEENILRSIATSRKTIILLSQHLVNSGWCKFEMHMARVHMMERGVDKIIVILLGDVSTADMPRTLVDIMRRHTYLVWPGEQMIDNLPAFWSRLRSALQGSIN